MSVEVHIKEGETDEWQVFSAWMEDLGNGEVGIIDRSAVRYVLNELSPNLNALEDLNVQVSLESCTNEGRSLAMKSIWGAERYKEFKEWAKRWISVYEAREGYKFGPIITRSGGRKERVAYSGLLGILGELTKFAYDDTFNAQQFHTNIGARVLNGRLREDNPAHVRLEVIPEAVRIERPDTHEWYRPGSFPSKFPKDLLRTLKDFNNE